MAFDRLEKEIVNGQGLKDLEKTAAREKVLSSLFYPEITARIDTVRPAWENTFTWIFRDQLETDGLGEKKRTWSSFTEWLRNNTSVYWINGKAGSGKSTLMAHIFHSVETKVGLEHWSNGHQFHMLSFFFWRAGSEIQKSIPGLLRSLLYQLCDKIPNMVVPLIAECTISASRIPIWTEKKLVALLQNALRNATNIKFCLFIDCLDEFEGDVDQLVNLVFNPQGSENVKCCLSSRPEVRLVERLSNFAQLRLQDFNKYDIQQFVRDKMREFSRSQTHLNPKYEYGASISFKRLGASLSEDFLTSKRRCVQKI